MEFKNNDTVLSIKILHVGRCRLNLIYLNCIDTAFLLVMTPYTRRERESFRSKPFGSNIRVTSSLYICL